MTCFIVDILNHGGAEGSAEGEGEGSDLAVVRLSKMLTLLFGTFEVLLAYLAQYIGQSLSVITAAVQAVCNAPVFGAFLLGMLNERARGADTDLAFVVATAFMVICLVAMGVCPN